jgi:hypothetical protein
MAMYRNVMMNFWTDRKVADDFTPEDRYFYLYLFTNPHTNLCGCYEISFKQVVAETGYSRDSIENLLKRFENVHDVIRYSTKTGEILILNWHKYNWTSSEKFRKPLLKELCRIKNKPFSEYLLRIFNKENDGYGIDTTCIDITDTVSVTDTVSDTVSDTKKTKRFTPPTVEEVQDYIDEKNYHVDAESFVNFYASKGWMVGKNKMVNWRSSVATWEKRNKKESINAPPKERSINAVFAGIFEEHKNDL